MNTKKKPKSYQLFLVKVLAHMISISCSMAEKDAKIEIYDEKLIIKSCLEKTILFIDIKSVNSKNSEKFFLKIKLEDSSFVFEFENMHLRDLVKCIFLDKIQTAESIVKTAIYSNIEYNKAYKRIKDIIPEQQFIKTVDSHSSLYFQKSIQEINPQNFFKSLNQPLVDIFITMNCTITQFFNLLVSSYFYDSKNQKNAFDRLLLLRLRDFNSGIDFASRINSCSLLDLAECADNDVDSRVVVSKPIEFEPIYPFKPELKKYSNSYDFQIKKLTVEFQPENQNEEVNFIFDQSDFEAAKELSRVMFNSYDEKIMKFSDDFTNLLIGKYGKESLKFVNRLIPSFYKKNSS